MNFEFICDECRYVTDEFDELGATFSRSKNSVRLECPSCNRCVYFGCLEGR